MKALFLATALLALSLNVAMAKGGAKKNRPIDFEPRTIKDQR